MEEYGTTGIYKPLVAEQPWTLRVDPYTLFSLTQTVGAAVLGFTTAKWERLSSSMSWLEERKQILVSKALVAVTQFAPEMHSVLP